MIWHIAQWEVTVRSFYRRALTLQEEIHLRRLPCGAFDIKVHTEVLWDSADWWFSAGIEPATAQLIGQHWEAARIGGYYH